MLSFANREDNDVVWANRPYHVQNKLVLLQPFTPEFDPLARIVSHADIWVRIPLLPIFFHNEHAQNMMIQANIIGTFIRLDENSSIKNRGNFYRFSSNVTISEVPAFVKIEHSDKSILTLKLWSEDFSPGCGCCGESDHLFYECFLNNLPSYVFEGFLVGSSDDEEAAKVIKQRMIDHFTKNLPAAAPQAEKGPTFIRKPLIPVSALDGSVSHIKGKSPINPTSPLPLQNIPYSPRQNPGPREISHSFQMHPAFNPKMYNSQLLAHMQHFSYAIPPPMNLTQSMTPRMVRPTLQNPQQLLFVASSPLHIEAYSPSPCASENSSSTILRKRDEMDIESTIGATTSIVDPKRKDELNEVHAQPPSPKKHRKSKAKKQGPIEKVLLLPLNPLFSEYPAPAWALDISTVTLLFS